MKKNSCTPINPKKYSCYGLKKIPAARKFPSLPPSPPPPSHNFSNGPSLSGHRTELTIVVLDYVLEIRTVVD